MYMWSSLYASTVVLAMSDGRFARPDAELRAPRPK